MGATVYDRIGVGYAAHRRPDPRIAATLLVALGDFRTVVDVGAGAGSYEPRTKQVVAVEPSPVMIAQRRPESASVVRARAESLPFADRRFDAGMAVLSVHHWSDPKAGLGELARVSRRQVVLGFDPDVHRRFWLFDYLPEAAARADGPAVSEVAEALGADRVEVVPVPHDCVDGFCWAYWCRPRAYLDAGVRSAISCLARCDASTLQPGLDRLAADIESGEWERRYGHLEELEAIDGGYRLVVGGPS
jgi:SAM-dependent methyltransferase